MVKKRSKNKASDLLAEIKDLVLEIQSIWFTPEIFFSFLQKIEKYVKENDKKYFDLDEFGMDPALVETLRPIFQFFYKDYWGVKVKGISNIPETARALIVANHSGAIPFDGTMVNMSVYNKHPQSRNVRFLVEDFVYHFPFLGNFISRIGGVRACPENAELLLEKDQLVSVFPEGIKGISKLYKDKYKISRFGRGGYVRLAIKTNTKIIPTAVVGAEETYPILAKTKVLAKPFGIPYFGVTPTFPHFGPIGLIPLPSKWIIEFGTPIDCSQYNPNKDADNDLLVFEINQKVRKQVSSMLKTNLRERGRPWKY